MFTFYYYVLGELQKYSFIVNKIIRKTISKEGTSLSNYCLQIVFVYTVASIKSVLIRHKPYPPLLSTIVPVVNPGYNFPGSEGPHGVKPTLESGFFLQPIYQIIEI